MILDNNSVGLVIKRDSYSINEEINEFLNGLARLEVNFTEWDSTITMEDLIF
jgi:hypothetical protein